jgi:hypothetical protein
MLGEIFRVGILALYPLPHTPLPFFTAVGADVRELIYVRKIKLSHLLLELFLSAW